MLPADGVVIGLEALPLTHMRKIVQHLHIKVAPDQLGQPDTGARTARQHAGIGFSGQLTDRDRAKAQMHAQVARAFDRREVARFFVLVNSRQKVLQQGLATRFSGWNFQSLEVGGLKTNVLQARDRVGQIVRSGGQA